MSMYPTDTVTPSEAPQITATTEPHQLVVDLKRSGANTPAELSPGSVNSDPDDGCDKYSCRSGESEVTATVHDDVPETNIVRPHSMFSDSDDVDHNSTRPSISASTNNGPEATITTTAMPPNKKPNLLNTYMRRVFNHYKVNLYLEIMLRRLYIDLKTLFYCPTK